MTIADLSSRIIADATARSCVKPKTLHLLSVLFVSACVFLGTTRCQAQDAAEASRQERARKSAEQKKGKHVYTEEDLRRSRILTSEDRAKLETRKNQQSPAPAANVKPQDALDATIAPAEVPLGDVARRFRKEKQARESRAAPFHLSIGEPALGAPLLPLKPKLSPALPAPAVRTPLMGSAPIRRVDPFAKRLSPVASAIPPRRPSAALVEPNASAVSSQPRPFSGGPQPKTSIDPRRSRPSDSQPLRVITVQHGDSLWKLAAENLGHASRWQEFLAVNPGIADAGRIVAGTRIFLPDITHQTRANLKIVVQVGDTLSSLAQNHYGRAGVWRCIAQANPQIADANHIFAGQQLLLPAACH
jgi:phage tail protein X